MWRGTRRRAPKIQGRDSARPSKSSKSFRVKFRQHPVEAFQNTLFAHYFEHVAKARANASTADCDARRMYQIAGLAAEFLSERLERRFKRLKIPLVDLCEFIAQSFQSHPRLRFAENLFNSSRIKLVIFAKEVARPLRNILEELDFLLHDREHVAEIFFIGDIDLSFLHERPAQLDEPIERHLRDILAVQPKTFVEIERGVATIDFFELEKFNDFLNVDLFPIVLRRPTQQTKIIADRLGRVTLFDVSGDRCAFIALAHLRSVAI